MGNVLFAGSFDGEQGVIAKYTPTGSNIWTKSLTGRPASVAADASGNVYVGGSFINSFNLGGNSFTSAGGVDAFVTKLAPNGDFAWAAQAGFVFDDVCSGLGVDAAGNVFIAGTFRDTTRFGTNIISGNSDDIFIAKLGNNTVPLVPVILSQPQNQSVSPGATATFGVVASGAPPLRFQWRFNGTNLSGATTSLLNITNALLANVGSYDVVVSNAAGVVISSPATLTVVPGTPSFADAFSGRGILIGFTNFVAGNNTSYTREPGEPDHAGLKGAHSAWLTWTAPDNGACEMDTLGSSFDTVLAIYTGTTLSNLTRVVANDDAAPGLLQSRVAFSAVAGTAYQIAVDGYSATDAGNLAFHLSFSNAAPIIAVQPQSHSVVQGSNTTFSVTALGIPPLAYQWRFNETDIPGGTNAILLISNAQPADEGNYSVVVANAFGSATSLTAALTLLRLPAISSLSPDTIVVAGNTLNLAVTATGTPPLSYQWLFNGTNLPGAVLPSLALSDIKRQQAGPYSVVVSNAYGAVTSGTVNVAVHLSLTLVTNGNGMISASPSLPSYPPLSTVTLSASPGPGAYFVNWSGMANATNNPQSLLLTSNRTVVANFAATSLTLGTQGPGTISKAPDRPFYSLGEQVVLTALPGRWHGFVRWNDGAVQNPRSIVIGRNNAYTATFTPTQALETVSYGGVTRTAPVGMPAILINGVLATSGTVSNFDTAQIEILSTFPDAVILFTLDGTAPGFASIFYDTPFAIRQNVTLRAVAYSSDFSQAIETDPLELVILRTHTLTSSTAGGGRIISNPATSRHVVGSLVTLTAEAESGWSFLQWLGDAVGTNATTSVLLNRDRCVEAVFGTAVNSTVIGAGTVAANPDTRLLPYGTVQHLTAMPGLGSYFAIWGGTGNGTNNPLRILVTNALPTVTAVFQPLEAGQHSLVVQAEGFGVVTNKPRGNRFNTGTSVTLTAVPNGGQQFVGWSGDASGTQNPLIVTLSSSKSITARFTKRATLTLQPCSEPSPEDGFQFLITGEFGQRYQVEANDGSQGWSPLALVTNLFSKVQFNDRTGTNSAQRFYRAVSMP